MIDKWETVETEKVKTGESSIKDVYVGKHLISEKTRERYLGDVIDSKRKMNSNIEKRVQKGHEKLWAILMTFASENITLLSQKCSEIHCFLVVSSLIVKHGIRLTKNIEELEKVENILLNKMFELPSSTPAVFLHLELGTLPIRFAIMTR